MIYVSSATLKNNSIKDSVKELAEFGFKNIELSGGTNYYDHEEIVKDLLLLKEEYKLNFLLHNYFPPPKEAFVLNLASNDEYTEQTSINHILKCIDISGELGAKKYGFHAGFFFNIDLKQIGKKITAKRYDNLEKQYNQFCENYNKIKTYSESKGIEIYIENNVYSDSNFQKYGSDNPLMLLSKQEYIELSNRIDFNLLLDVAHLKVSAKTLQNDFEAELTFLSKKANYIHISDNNGLEDQNNSLKEDSKLYKLLSSIELKNKTITLEIYDSLENVNKSYNLINSLI